MKQFNRWSPTTMFLALVLVGTRIFPRSFEEDQSNIDDTKALPFDVVLKDEEEGDVESFDNRDSGGFGKLGEVEVIEEYVNGTTEEPDLSQEPWVKGAVLDVAYFLRSHKFNDFDRRYYNESAGQKAQQFNYFPRPPLRYLHWEVYKFCDRGFYHCLFYLNSVAEDAALTRSLDSSKIVNDHKWEYPRNAGLIEAVEKECVRLREIDWTDADPFKGPLERFQWRVSASYYMCHYTMLEYPPLIMFGERCDNFANCLVSRSARNNDPRADDSKPFQCAMYSFCPDACCHKKLISDIKHCWGLEDNPCGFQSRPEMKLCGFNRENNKDLASIVLNEWNVTCYCEQGYIWESMFGFCVDIDECSTGTHTCSPTVEICINLKGTYSCACAWGYINITGGCVPNTILNNALDDLHALYHKPKVERSEPFSFRKYFYDLIGGIFSINRTVENATEQPSTTELSQFTFDN
uniref:EGF-like calcium-binding domain-containing protein n=1 Tax=Cuerna arida TaxID=1464854 RepID=A0A1B6G4V7_9HEMI